MQNVIGYCFRQSVRKTTNRKKMITTIFLTIILIIGIYFVTLRKEKITEEIMSYSPTTIVNYFIKKHSETGQLTPLKLIKLVYISYGWYLETFNLKQLVNERPQAWKYGPVFPSLYDRLKIYGKNFIKEPLLINSSEVIEDNDAEFLDKIWNIYGEKDGIYLSALTHQENTPWSYTYPKGENVTIPDNLIKEHYKKLSE